MMYEELIKRIHDMLLAYRVTGNENCSQARLFSDAAKAIEALVRRCDQLQSIRCEQINIMPLSSWISVNDRLPEYGELVLGYTPCDGYMFVGKCYTYKFGNETDTIWQIITAMRSTRTMKKKVTHWMPLPAAPESNNEK